MKRMVQERTVGEMRSVKGNRIFIPGYVDEARILIYGSLSPNLLFSHIILAYEQSHLHNKVAWCCA